MPRHTNGRSWCSLLLPATGVTAFLVSLGLAHPALAQLASRPAEEWIKTLEAPARVDSLKIPEVIAALKITPGQIVADIGAGTGLFSLPMALKVKPGGEVYAVDLDKALVDYITEKATEQGLINVHGVVGQPTDPAMPVNVNLALICDVLHHVEDRAGYLKMLAEYLQPGGRIAVIDFGPDQSPHKSDPALVVSEAQADAWMAAAGLTPIEHVSLFTDKWFVIYAKP